MNKRNLTSNYFIIPNEIFCLGLCSGELSVYSYLRYCENRKTYKCYPSYKTIGKAIKMSVNTVSKYVKMLVDKNLILTEYTTIITQKGKKRNGNLMYTIRPINDAIEHSYQIQLENLINEKRKSEIKQMLDRNAS